MRFLSVISILFLAACSNTTLQIVSEPSEADVTYVVNNVEKKLGVTPITLAKQDVTNLEKNGFKLRFEKPGFLKEQIVVDSTYFRKIGEIKLNLTPLANWSEASQDPQANTYLNDVASLSAEIQALTIKREYGKAETLAKSLVTRYPKLSVGWNLMGNIYYLQRRVGEAVSAYTKALALNPQDKETRRVLEQLRGSTI